MKTNCKIRIFWKINPEERIVESKKRYSRKKEKQELKEILDNDNKERTRRWVE